MEAPLLQDAAENTTKVAPLPDPTFPFQLLSETEAARVLGVSPRTLQKWRNKKRGPEFVQISTRCVRYSLASLQAWTASKRSAA